MLNAHKNILFQRVKIMNATESLENIRILYVEDDKTNQIVLKSLLGLVGFKSVSIADCGQRALEMLAQPDFQVDLILMDIGLPDIDGITLTEKIRSSDFTAKSVPIIALSGNVAQAVKEKSRTAGMNDFLSKPVDKEELRKVILNALSSS
jgi:CheY-like chemotaxis protein